MRLLRFFFGFIALGTTILSAQSVSRKEIEEMGFAQKFLASVRSCIEYNQEMVSKEEMDALVDRLAADSKIIESGSDDLRVKFVGLQGCIEHVLACSQALGEIREIIGVIHTPSPATPLCARSRSDTSDLLDESIRRDPKKLLTVLSRTQIVREYLMKGGKLYVAYPRGGLEKRSSEQQKIYREALDQFQGNLIDQVLATDAIPQDIVGATYVIRTANRQLYAFSIKSRQANDIQDLSEWGLWFGPVQNLAIAARINEVFNYLSRVGGPDLRNDLDWD